MNAIPDQVTVYRMNPAEDTVIYGDQLAEGMWVLADSEHARLPGGSDEDSRIRAQRFRRVTQLRRQPAKGDLPAQTVFIGEWVDGYQRAHSYAVTHGWIVKRDSMPGGAS